MALIESIKEVRSFSSLECPSMQLMIYALKYTKQTKKYPHSKYVDL